MIPYVITASVCEMLIPLQGHGVRVTSDNSEVVRRSSVVWIATKPHTVAPVLREISPVVRRDQLFVSVAAGTTLNSLAKVNCVSFTSSLAEAECALITVFVVVF